jgi:outer membrane lipoprotein-sorting protein
MSLLLVLILTSVNQCLLSSQFTLSTITVDKTTTKEVVKGNLYVVDEQMVLFEVSSPVNQLMWIKRDTVDIYYPDKQKLFRILSHDTLPTQNTAISGVLNMDLERQLHLAGLKVLKAEKSADTFLFYWEFKEISRNSRKMPEIVTGRIGQDFVLYRTQTKGFKLEFQLGKYETISGGKRYPSFLRSTVQQGKTKRIEELRLKGVKTNASLPDHLVDFKIPQDAEIKIVEW